MNIKDLHTENNSVSAKPLFKGEGNLISIQIIGGQILKEHITKIPAMLICVEGIVVYKDEKQREVKLLPGDYITIEAMVKHWVEAVEYSSLLLMK